MKRNLQLVLYIVGLVGSLIAAIVIYANRQGIVATVVDWGGPPSLSMASGYAAVILSTLLTFIVATIGAESA